jgi:hypothetical protein
LPRLLVVHHTPSSALQEMFEAAVSRARTDGIEDVEVVGPAGPDRRGPWTSLRLMAICSALQKRAARCV